MDARPQRPLRTLRVQGDENAPPQMKPTLHQRHKSTGTLSAMMAVGGLRAAAKRTAFGDVSNTAKNLSAVHDDSVLSGKSIHLDSIKPPVPQEKQTATLLRPAQRLLNIPASRGPLNSNLITTVLEPTSNALSAAIDPRIPQPAANKRVISKNTNIYKDTAEEPRPATSQAIKETLLTAPVHQHLEPRQRKSQPQLKQEQPPPGDTQSKSMGSSDEEKKPLTSDPIYQDAVEEIKDLDQREAYESYGRMVEHNREEREVVKNSQDDFDGQSHQLPPPPLVSDPEEYWEEEEEEEEIYDEQGYTTAHSYRSKGENTTGGATTVLFPKVTNKAKKEIAAAKELVESARTAEEVEDEAWDTSMVAEYGDEIFSYMRELEIRMLPNAHYMDNQAEIQWSMRSVLMDWLIQVHHRFSLLPETLFLCVNYIDRFLSCKIVSLGKLQLVGATAIFVAAKYEEINCPSVSEIVYMVDGGYTVDEILKAERFMLTMLQFELGWPGPMSFLRRISKADDYDLESRTLAKYFLEVTIMDERFVGSPPSYIAAGAHCFSRLMLKKGDWTPAHVYYSGYTWTQLRPLVSMIMGCCENPQKHHSAVFEKYSDRRYKRASLFVQAEMTNGYVLPAIQYANSRPSLPSLEDAAANISYEKTRDSFKRMVQVKG
ncbi:hypothetical protein B7494_g3046 [Chlorociboria aeruginascens]|nr:hypothetical protein B7494_g3046 [Chlorociboria aeruginascens]